MDLLFVYTPRSVPTWVFSSLRVVIRVPFHVRELSVLHTKGLFNIWGWGHILWVWVSPCPPMVASEATQGASHYGVEAMSSRSWQARACRSLSEAAIDC